MLAPDTAQNLGLAFHELATNASKYGALAADTGELERHLDADGRADPHHLARARRAAGRPAGAARLRAGAPRAAGRRHPQRVGHARLPARGAGVRDRVSRGRPRRDVSRVVSGLSPRPGALQRPVDLAPRGAPQVASAVAPRRRISPRQVLRPLILSSRLSEGSASRVSRRRVSGKSGHIGHARLRSAAASSSRVRLSRVRRPSPSPVNRSPAFARSFPRATNVNAPPRGACEDRLPDRSPGRSPAWGARRDRLTAVGPRHRNRPAASRTGSTAP